MSDTLRMLILLAVVVLVVGVRQYVAWTKHVASVAEGLLKLRRLQGEDATYVPLGPKDAPAAAAKDTFERATQELAALDFSVLGDRMEQRPNGTRLGPSRWFAHRGGQVCGWFAVLATPRGVLHPVMVFFSESEANEFFTTTRGGASPHLAQPPNLVREVIPWSEGINRAVERHRASAAKAQGALKVIGTAEDAAALLQRLRVNTRAWRATQPREGLLEADLRSVLGKHHDRMARAVGEYVKDRA